MKKKKVIFFSLGSPARLRPDTGVEALELPAAGEEIASYVPIEVLWVCRCVSIGWKARWSCEHVFLHRFALDVSEDAGFTRSHSETLPSGSTHTWETSSIRAPEMMRIVQRIPSACESIDLNLNCCEIGELGAVVLAGSLPLSWR